MLQNMLQETLTTSFFLISGTIFIRILSFRRQSLSEKIYTLNFGVPKISAFLKIIFLDLLDPSQTVF